VSNVPESWWQNRTTGPKLRKDLKEKRFNFVTGWYRKKIYLPGDLAPGRIMIEFDGVDYETTLYVNNKKVGLHHGRFCSFRFDITDFVKLGGENLIAVRVMMDCPQGRGPGIRALQGYRMGRYPQFNIGGIYEHVRLVHRPEAYVDRVQINPFVSRSLVDADIETRNTAGKPIKAKLTAEIIPWEREGGKLKAVVTKDCGRVTLPAGKGRINIEVPAVKLTTWEITRPQLYWLRLQFVHDGRIIEDFYERFGYREFLTKGRQFFLNGRPFYIMSELKVYTDARPRGQASPEWMRRYIRERRKNNFNFIRFHGGAWPEWIYDICDEEGLMVKSEWNAAWGKQDEKNGQIPAIAEEMMELFRRNYNHPSWAILGISNESSANAILAHTYRYFKRLDKQNRPIISTSGGQLYIEPIVYYTDVYDVHLYYGVGGYPASFIPGDIELLRLTVKKFRGTDDFPFVINECNIVRGGDINKAVPDDQYKRYTVDEYLSKAGSLGASDPERQVKMIPISSIVPNRPERPSWQAAQFVKKLVEMFRIDDELVQGILPWQSYPSQGRQNFQPVFIGSDLNWHNKAEFAGERHTFKVYLRDYDIDPRSSVSIQLWVEDLKGNKILQGKPIDVGDIKAGTRRDFDYSWDLPGHVPTGDYLLKLAATSGQKEISHNLYELYILGADDRKPKMPSAKVAVLKPRGLDGPSGKNIPAILDELDVAYTVIPDHVPDLEKYDVLILPAYYGTKPLERRSLPMYGTGVRLTELPESFRQLTDREKPSWEQVYPKLVQAGGRINKWIRSGGRILSFEQFCQGPVPWQDELRIAETGYNCFVDPVRGDHPAVKDFMIRDFADWEGERGVIIDYTVFPFNQNVIASVSTYGYHGHPGGFGMALAETRIGKGSSMLSQLNAVRRYGRDSIATHYVNELIKYTLAGDIWEDVRSSPSVAEGQRPDVSFHPTKYEQSFIGGERWAAQSFTPKVITNILRVDLEIWRSQDPPGALIVELRTDDNGKPGGRILTKVVREAGSFPRRRGYPNWENPFKKFNIRYRGLKPGRTYWLVAHAEGPDLFPNIYSWIRGRDADGQPYGGGVGLVSSDGGKTWRVPTSKHETDFGIKIYGVTDEYLPKWNVATDKAVKIDLRSWCTTGFKDEVGGDGRGGWTDQGDNDIRHIPTGELVWQGVPLRIIDPTTNNGKSCVMLRGKGREDLPDAVKGIRINGKAKALYFTHTAAWFYDRGVFYVIHYEDGTVEKIELVGNVNLADWWHPRDLPGAALGWKDGHPISGGEVGVWMMRWQNPHPNKKITTIDFAWLRKGRGIVALFAITAESP